ncbi:hypothetical protein DICVIV_02503 [Dictyocaulus viviparus]|uniref:Uncharacterized protein n=1 Tax=Dictyocaulus viviparus TaxID=29172 RepID=A0A0D8Y3M0_DICVI|nr:hypothetical protein DICVIV_02503 [Dictyocaulus viviparus]
MKKLQVCCNVSRVKIWNFNSVSNFNVSRIVYESDFSFNEDDLYLNLQLSICTDRLERTIGWIEPKPGVKCTYSTLQTLNIPHGALTIPNWYVICFVLNKNCQICRIDILCESDLTHACANRHVLGSSPKATNSSIHYWFEAGDKFPFENSSYIELKVMKQNDDQIVVHDEAGEKKTLTLSGLDSNEVYGIRRCIVIELPTLLTNDQRFSFDNSSNRVCTEEIYRTLSNTMFIRSIWITVLFVISIPSCLLQ